MDMDEFVQNSRIGRNLLEIQQKYNDLDRLRDVQGKTRQRNSIKARIAELSRDLPRFFPTRPNPPPLDKDGQHRKMVNELLETYAPYASPAAPRSRLHPHQNRPRVGGGGNKVPTGFVDFNIGEDRKKLVGKIVRVNQNGHKYRGIVTDMTVSGAQVQSTSDNRTRIVHPSKLTIVGSAFETPGDHTSRSVSSDHFERVGPALTAPAPSGFVMSREDELENNHDGFSVLEQTVQDILVIVKRSYAKTSIPLASRITQAILPELTVVQTNLKISYTRTRNLYKALVAAFVYLYLDHRMNPTPDIPNLVSTSGYIPSIEKGGRAVSAQDFVHKFVELLRAKYSVNFPIVDTQTISYIGRAKNRRYVQMHKDSWPSMVIGEGEMGAGNKVTFFTHDEGNREDPTSTLPVRNRTRLSNKIKYGPSLAKESLTEDMLFELNPDQEEDLQTLIQMLESKEEQLVDRLQQKQSDPLHERIRILKVSGNPSVFNTNIDRIDARLDEIATELVQFSQERERKLAMEKRRNPLGDFPPEDDPKYIRLKRKLLYKEKARLMAKRTSEQKKNKSDISDKRIEALRSELRDATTDVQKQLLSNQLREAKHSKNADSLVDEEIAQAEAQLVRKYGNPEIMLNRLQKLRRLRELRAKSRESMGDLF